MQFDPEPHRSTNAEKDGRDQGRHLKTHIYIQQHNRILPQFKSRLKTIGKKEPPRLGGGRRRDGYILRIWMGASAGPFSSKPVATRQPLSVNA